MLTCDNRAIFDIGGNKYRLIAHIAYGFGRILVKFVGTHKEYNRVNPERVMENIRPLHSEDDYKWALKEVEQYFQSEPALGSAAADRFDVLSALIEQYEDKHYDLPDADPIEVLQFAMESMGRTQADLTKLLESSSRASEVLNRRRKLTLEMIRLISVGWNIPVEALTAEYELDRHYA